VGRIQPESFQLQLLLGGCGKIDKMVMLFKQDNLSSIFESNGQALYRFTVW
jgi:hypothetical protein